MYINIEQALIKSAGNYYRVGWHDGGETTLSILLEREGDEILIDAKDLSDFIALLQNFEPKE